MAAEEGVCLGESGSGVGVPGVGCELANPGADFLVDSSQWI